MKSITHKLKQKCEGRGIHVEIHHYFLQPNSTHYNDRPKVQYRIAQDALFYPPYCKETYVSIHVYISLNCKLSNSI